MYIHVCSGAKYMHTHRSTLVQASIIGVERARQLLREDFYYDICLNLLFSQHWLLPVQLQQRILRSTCEWIRRTFGESWCYTMWAHSLMRCICVQMLYCLLQDALPLHCGHSLMLIHYIKSYNKFLGPCPTEDII